MRRITMAVLGAGGALLAPLTAEAAYITFDLTTGGDGVFSGLNFTSLGTTVGVVAQRGSYSSSTNTLVVPWSTITGDGLGIRAKDTGLGVLSSLDGDGSDLDGGGSNNYAFDPDEALLFSFGQDVRLVSVGFSGIDSSDDFALDIDGTTQFVDRLLETPFESQVFGREFRIWTDSDNDSFKVASITIDTGDDLLFQVSESSISSVGEPRAAATFAVGLAALGYGLRRRRRRQPPRS